MNERIGTHLNRYLLQELLGEGGMGSVFKGYDETLHRFVAVKVLHPHFAKQPKFQERFLREARAAAAMDHAGIVKVYDFGQSDDLLFIVMEFIPGSNLRELLTDLRATNRWISLPEAVELGRQVCLAIDYAHLHGILHRDIKPDNIMVKVDQSGILPYRPVLTDLGLARLLDEQAITQVGESMGTPAYMSPEQAMGETTDVRSDVYSLGVLLFELVTGQVPFPAKTITEAIRYHTRESVPCPTSINPDIPAPLEAVILKTLEKDPGDRIPDAGSLAQALERSLTSQADISTETVQDRRSEAEVEVPLTVIQIDLSQERTEVVYPPYINKELESEFPFTVPASSEEISDQNLETVGPLDPGIEPAPVAHKPVRRRRMWIPISISILGVSLLAISIWWVARDDIAPTSEPIAQTSGPAEVILQITPIARSVENGRSLGDPNAPVMVDVYEDFQCTYCRDYSNTTEMDVLNKYVTAGKVYYTFHHYPFFDTDTALKESQQAANASMCAAEQNRFWDYKDILFANQKGENQGAFTDKRLLAFAEALGLDMNKFTTCFNANTYKQDIQTDVSSAQQLGVPSVPSMLINGQQLPPGDIHSFEEISQAIDAALAGQ